MSIEQEAAVRFISNIHIPSKYSPPLRTQFQSSAPRFTGVLIVGWKQCIKLWIYCFSKSWLWQIFRPAIMFLKENKVKQKETNVTLGQVGALGGGSEPGCFVPLGRLQRSWLWQLCSALESVVFFQAQLMTLHFWSYQITTRLLMSIQFCHDNKVRCVAW